MLVATMRSNLRARQNSLPLAGGATQPGKQTSASTGRTRVDHQTSIGTIAIPGRLRAAGIRQKYMVAVIVGIAATGVTCNAYADNTVALQTPGANATVAAGQPVTFTWTGTLYTADKSGDPYQQDFALTGPTPASAHFTCTAACPTTVEQGPLKPGVYTWTLTGSYPGCTQDLALRGIISSTAAKACGPQTTETRTFTVAAPAVAADTTRPKTRAFPATLHAGKTGRLSFTASDNSPVTATLTVTQGKTRTWGKTFKRLSGGLVYSAPWKPKRAGTYRACITAVDLAGNQSRQSCAAVTVKNDE